MGGLGTVMTTTMGSKWAASLQTKHWQRSTAHGQPRQQLQPCRLSKVHRCLAEGRCRLCTAGLPAWPTHLDLQERVCDAADIVLRRVPRHQQRPQDLAQLRHVPAARHTADAQNGEYVTMQYSSTNQCPLGSLVLEAKQQNNWGSRTKIKGQNNT